MTTCAPYDRATAKGILMVTHGVTGDNAIDMLRTMSQTTNVKLRDVAAQLVNNEHAPARD